MIKSVNPSGRGGKRIGAGRPPKWSTKHFKTIRVPVCLAAQVMEVARYLDGQDNSYRKLESFEDDESPDYDCAKAMEFAHLHYCAEVLGYQKNQLQREVEQLKAQLKSIQRQKFRVL
ncbi:hypothetical protein [Microcoleus sp. Pol7_B1]|uniref:hypothetical protein n=1 Tax=Microcoleus sp. Pol7_B1 TaxID=2818894 RepID=UPI002FD2C2F4